MVETKYVRYGDRTMEMEAGMTLEQVKELMARHFPELADPKVETKKDGDKTTYVFSKKNGHKGHGARRPYARTIKQLRQSRESFVVDVRVVDYITDENGDAYNARALADTAREEMERVIAIRTALVDLPGAAPKSGSVL